MPVMSACRGRSMVRPSVIPPLVSIDFEGNSLTGAGAFDSVVDATGDLSVSAAAALRSSSYGMAVVINDQTADYGIKAFTASTTNVWRARLYIDPNGLTMGANENFYVLQLMNSSGASFAWVKLRYSTQFIIRCGLTDDNSTEAEIAFNITDAPHCVEIKLTRSTGADNGRLDAWVDGVAGTALTDKDNDTRAANCASVRLGSCSGIDPSTSGTYYLDELVVNDTGAEIGA